MRAAAAAVLLVALAGCSTGVGEAPPRPDRTTPSATSAPAPDQPTTWGPTTAELDRARELVAGWSPEQLAGQVIVGRYDGTDPGIPADLVRDLHLAGVCVTSGNVVDEAQVRATTAAVGAALAEDGRRFPAVIGVDEEGGPVAHLRGIATTFPAFRTAGLAIERDQRQGRSVVRSATRASGLELRDLGFTWVFAPVADVTIGAADPTIGARSPSSDPEVAALATAAAVRGYDAAGIVSTTKHFPGHGGVTADSHEVVPVLDAPLGELRQRDLVPFEAAVAAGAPSVMVSHVDVRAIAPGVPATLAPETYDFLRADTGFEGVAITDSMGMGAVVGKGQPVVAALQAGADLLLMPADTRRTHATVTAAIESGEVPRERAEQAAARVVALQLWQERVAAAVPVPADVAERAAGAAAALTAAAY